LSGQGFRIGVTIPELAGKEVILSHRVGLKFFTDDTVKLQQDGHSTFIGDTLLPQGMYQIVFPDKKYVEFFIGPVQFFDLKTRLSSPNDSLVFTGSPENTRFAKWQNEYSKIRLRTSYIQDRLKKGGLTKDSSDLLTKELRTLQGATSFVWDEAIKDLKGSLPGKFIQGLRSVRIPDSLMALKGQEGQYKQYLFLRNHFFDNVPLDDERLLYTPLIETKYDQFFNQLVPPFADSIIREARNLIEKTRVKPDIFQYTVQYLLNLYSDPKVMGTDAVYVWLAENYYLTGQAWWITKENLQGIMVRVSELKPLLIGTPAPPLLGLENPDGAPVTLDAFTSRFLIVYFWDPGCSHCKETTPKLFQQYPELKAMGADVIAIDTHVEKPDWLSFINEHQLTWTNAISPKFFKENTERWQAWSTPRIFILGPDKKIIAKDIGFDQVKAFLQQVIAMERQR
jgi:thiol-disulfide isomerase/thioredoxin